MCGATCMSPGKHVLHHLSHSCRMTRQKNMTGCTAEQLPKRLACIKTPSYSASSHWNNLVTDKITLTSTVKHVTAELKFHQNLYYEIAVILLLFELSQAQTRSEGVRVLNTEPGLKAAAAKKHHHGRPGCTT